MYGDVSVKVSRILCLCMYICVRLHLGVVCDQLTFDLFNIICRADLVDVVFIVIFMLYLYGRITNSVRCEKFCRGFFCENLSIIFNFKF